ncbi:hypothetical protein HanRHA438_Chr01g0038581 [Helianthus annuus]|uniref:Transposase (putative) gypsy type domain-containing protein n=1 Tax=Helianthus annuus TaxID=4232 RepID=A0A9K3P464_HELAN|nr:hypothetical protein HanXRQr2_Chr01g0037651 [Helianthus annuus]KAJ0612731.1 hypothetical protein HanHA300_Chr01g0030671 [Helianthus annuus]KAJ0628098.1 hypothetical protein HanHA89_Chr01g0033031 [Helianthus annuus]KAJ0784386.1 hypothetical protein HanLR1_Chr01g0031531 [Helianthus annuus]KAJ0949429.1 hypothetical protein HanRHA438_Chr01g0038581 [Helianthus annuus]
MSTSEKSGTPVEETSLILPPLKWSEATFKELVTSFKFPPSWGAIYPQEGQMAAQALAGYITLFWEYFADGNFRLPVTKFLIEVLSHYRFHLSQLHPVGLVRIHHFEFLCQSMGIQPMVDRFQVFYQLHCSLGFYSFQQRLPAKKILLVPPKSYHD